MFFFAVAMLMKFRDNGDFSTSSLVQGNQHHRAGIHLLHVLHNTTKQQGKEKEGDAKLEYSGARLL